MSNSTYSQRSIDRQPSAFNDIVTKYSTIHFRRYTTVFQITYLFLIYSVCIYVIEVRIICECVLNSMVDIHMYDYSTISISLLTVYHFYTELENSIQSF